MSNQDPQLRSIHDARHALIILGYPQSNVDQFVPNPDNPPTNPIIGQPNQRQRRLLLCALRSQRDRLEKLAGRTPASEVLSNVRADLDTTKELIATLQQT